MHYETLFADEAEDGLTQERKAQFYRMDRAALNIGGYQRKFFVSHNPDAWAMAEAVIDMNDYRSTH
jgi:exonuclease SbcC